MEKCSVCTAPVDYVFLEKIDGTYLKVSGKKKAVCSACQKKYSLDLLRTKI